MSFFIFRLNWHYKREKPVFWKASFVQDKDWLRVQASCKDFATAIRICVLISALNKRVLLYFSGKLFYKSNGKLFSCVCISWYKHSRGLENSRQSSKPSTSSRVCITVPNSPIPSRVYIRLCKHGKRSLLLKCYDTSCTISCLGWDLLGSSHWFTRKKTLHQQVVPAVLCYKCMRAQFSPRVYSSGVHLVVRAIFGC